jgi:hypothetical protein
MIDVRLQNALNAAGSSTTPNVTRFYRDGPAGSEQPAVVVQRDVQGIRIMLRAEPDIDSWTTAWFAEDGALLSVEKFSAGSKRLDSKLAEDFLSILEAQPLKDMARENFQLGT